MCLEQNLKQKPPSLERAWKHISNDIKKSKKWRSDAQDTPPRMQNRTSGFLDAGFLGLRGFVMRICSNPTISNINTGGNVELHKIFH